MVKKEEDVVDLVFKHKLEQKAKIKKAKKRKRRKKITIILIAVLSIYLYYSTDISKPKAITVSNNYILTKEEVINKSEIDLDTMLLIANPFYIKHNLKKDNLIKDVEVSWSPFKRLINIKVIEKDIFAYRQKSEEAHMILEDGSHLDLKSEYYKFLPNLIFLEGFEEEASEARLLESFDTLSDDVKNQVSEIHQQAVSFDDNYIEIRMNDGNKVYTSFQTVASLNFYFDIVKNLKSDNSCIIIDEMTSEAYSQACKEIEDSE